jgi:hypothetical protein
MKKIFCFLSSLNILLGSCTNNTDSQNKTGSDTAINPKQSNLQGFDSIPRHAAFKMIRHYKDSLAVKHTFPSSIQLVRFSTDDLSKFSEGADSVNFFMAADTISHEHTMIIQRKVKSNGQTNSVFYNLKTFKPLPYATAKAATCPLPRDCPPPTDDDN